MPPGSAMVFVGPNTLYPRANCLRTQIGLAFTRIARPRECHDLERGTNMQNSTDAVSRDKLIADFKVVVAGRRGICCKLTAGQAGENADGCPRTPQRPARGGEGPHRGRRSRGTAADEEGRRRHLRLLCHKNPWQSVGVAAGVRRSCSACSSAALSSVQHDRKPRLAASLRGFSMPGSRPPRPGSNCLSSKPRKKGCRLSRLLLNLVLAALLLGFGACS